MRDYDYRVYRTLLVLLWVIIGLLAAAVMLLMTASAASAHEWYPWRCCNMNDCFAVEVDEIEWTDTGWRLPNGQTVPFSASRYVFRHHGVETDVSPDGHFHVCTQDGTNQTSLRTGGDKGLCFWPPESGV